MVSDSDGSRFDHFCGSSLVESHRWCSGVDLDHRLVRVDNGCSGNHFWLSLAQLADTGNPLIRGKTSSVLPSDDSGPFCVSWKRHRPVRKLFVRLGPMAAGLLKKKCGLERLIGRLPYGAGIWQTCIVLQPKTLRP